MTRLLLIALVFLSFGCEKPDDVARIRSLLTDAIDAAERQDINGLMEHVGPDFTASPGKHDEQRVRGILLISFRRLGTFQIKHPVPGITLGQNGNTATASLPFIVVREGREVPDLSEAREDPAAWLAAAQEAVGEPYRVEMKLRKSGDDWIVTSAQMSGLKSYHQL